ncbi:hypothetical protein K3495_g6326 [Podosphaera aphanis]|nr:hypothetical protein K3495_g6326 [Podosphaera aphanis]
MSSPHEVPQPSMAEMMEMILSTQNHLATVQQQLQVVTQKRDQARVNLATASGTDTIMSSTDIPAGPQPVILLIFITQPPLVHDTANFATSTCIKRPKHKLPELNKFSGKRSEYRIWALAAKQKIKKDGDAIGTPGDQCDYIFARMEPDAQNLVAVYYERGLTAGLTAVDFLAHLDTIFTNPNATKRALLKLINTPQRDNESFALYFPRFERLLHEAGIEGDINCISYLENNISFELTRALVGNNIPDTYSEYVAYLLKTSSQLEAVNSRARRRNKPLPFTQTSLLKIPICAISRK